jgi:hypothetical protein
MGLKDLFKRGKRDDEPQTTSAEQIAGKDDLGPVEPAVEQPGASSDDPNPS